jgi:hypothetical protein
MDDFFEGESITRGCGFMVEVGLMGARRLFWKVGYHYVDCWAYSPINDILKT